ncbi:MAG: MMPL family transporter, partial [Planctomycetales bacterium]|nr:MMPL family transporter [Planctomycetales bacterium]
MLTSPRLLRIAVIVLLGVCLPYIIYAAHRAEESVENRPGDWLPAHFPETQRLMWLDDVFGGDELLMISYPGCELDDQRLPALADRLESAKWEGIPVFRRVVTGRDLLEEFRGEPLNLSRSAAESRLKGWVLGPEGETCAVVMISSEGKSNRDAALREVRRAADAVGLLAHELKIAGATMESVAINRVSTQWYLELSIASLAICLTLMYLSLRSIALTLTVFGTALISERLSLAWMHITNSPTDSVSTMTPALVYVLAISSGVHLANYYRDEVTSGDLQSAPRRAARNAWKPCFLATLTTAIGLGSLLLSDLTPVQRFGTFAAVGVIGMLAVQFLVLPFLLEYFPPRKWAARIRISVHSDPLSAVWHLLANLIVGRHAAIVVCGMALFVLGTFGVGRLQATARLHNLLPEDAPVLQDYAWLESHIGPLVPLEVVLRFRADDPLSLLERAQLVEQVSRVIAETPDVGNAINATMWA